MADVVSASVDCDLHTHTISSGHAFSTVDELATAAADTGVALIAVTDHGPSMEGAPHAGYFEMVGRLPTNLSGVRVLLGVEANIVSGDGHLDLDTEILRRQEIVLAGLHERTPFRRLSRAGNTRAIARAMESGSVDVISHPYRPCFLVDVKELARVSAATGVLLEINISLLRWALADLNDSERSDVVSETRTMVAELAHHGGHCVISSDAHHSAEVRAFSQGVRDTVEALRIPPEIIANRRVTDLDLIFSRRTGLL